MKFKIFSAVLVLMACVTPCWAVGDVDPLARNLVFVKGEAEITVPVDGFELRFSWEVNKGSFEAAIEETNKTIAKIEAYAKGLGNAQVEVIKGWDLVRQEKISFGAKGRKISNSLSVRVVGFPEGKLFDWITKIIDNSLAVDTALSLDDVEVFLSPAIEEKKRAEVTIQAVKNLQANATAAIEAMNKTMTSAKQVFITGSDNQPDPVYRHDYRMKSTMLSKEAAGSLSQSVNIQKSFKVRAQIADQIRLNAVVSGVYEMSS